MQPYLILPFLIIIAYKTAQWRLATTELAAEPQWRSKLWRAVLFNIIGFGAILLYFNLNYGFVTDDVNYYYPSLELDMPFSEVISGGDFMRYITRPFSYYLSLQLLSMHFIFGTIGFLGSLFYFYTFTQRVQDENVPFLLHGWAPFWAFYCFPNFLAWGRIYGKDTTVFFLGAIFTFSAFRILKKKVRPLDVLVVCLSVYFMQIIRPHVAGVIGAGFMIGLAYKYFVETPIEKNIFKKILIPMILVIGMTFLVANMARKVTMKQKGEEELTQESIQSTLITTTMQGAYGGSKTDLATEMKENPEIVYSPGQILENVAYLLLAPMPWQVRGAADFVALLSNIVMVYIVFRFGRKIRLFDSVQISYLATVIGLVLVLSFMTANVGLLLRQKTIILPFLFLLLFSRPSAEKSEGAEDVVTS
ncbi:MAG: hypothetical protein V1913_17415 [Fibrobacterota bacterium]